MRSTTGKNRSRSGKSPAWIVGPLHVVPAALVILASVLAGGCKEGGKPHLLVLEAGPNNPGASPGLTGDRDVPVLQIALTAGRGSVTISSVVLHASGTGDDSTDLSGVRLYRDADGDGVFDGGDALLGMATGYPVDDGDLLFTGLAERLEHGERIYWLLVYDMAPGAPSGRTFCAGILDGTGVKASGGGRGALVRLDGAIQGCVGPPPGSLSLRPGSNMPPGRAVAPCAAGEEVLQLQIDVGPREGVIIETMTFTASGTGDDLLDLAGVWLYADENSDGLLDASDTELAGPRGYGRDDGAITFSALGRTIAASGSETWILVYNFAGRTVGTPTFGALLEFDTDVAATGALSGEPVSVTGAPLGGNEILVEETVFVSATYEDREPYGFLNVGDVVRVLFSHEVTIPGRPVADAVFELDPPGTFGSVSRVPAGSNLIEVGISLAPRATLQPNGTYGIHPGSSGLALVAGQGSILNCAGVPVRPNPALLDLAGEVNPLMTVITLLDSNPNCALDLGDRIVVDFTTDVTFNTADPGEAFVLPVAGDTFGTGSWFLGGVPTDVRTVTVVLGNGPALTPPGVFDPLDAASGRPSGMDVTATSGVVVDALHPVVSAAPYEPAGVDVPDQTIWVSVGDDQNWAEYGAAVATAGDVNGDGYDDVIVGASRFSTSNQSAGKAYVYPGGPGGLSPGPDWTSVGDDLSYAYFGTSVASAGDVNGDGFDDVIVGAPYVDTTRQDVGKAYVYLGGPGGLSPGPVWTSVGDDQTRAYLGTSVASAGDVNGDGFDDIIAGAPAYRWNRTRPGKAFVYLGASGGPSPTPIWTSSGDGQAGVQFGIAVASVGDVDGDGYDDIVVGAPYFKGVTPSLGKAYVYLGGPAGPSSTPSWTSTGDDDLWGRFGWSVASGGDVNGDGFSDLIVGASVGNNNWGKGYVFLGGATGLSGSPAWTSAGDDQVAGLFGGALSSAGDLNADGYDDVVVGAPGFHTWNLYAGKAYIFTGGPGGLSLGPVWTSSGDDRYGAWFGGSVASAGDVNGDGLPEIIIGAYNFDSTSGRVGKAYVYCVRP